MFVGSKQQPNISDILAQAFRGDIFTKMRMNPQLAPFLSQPDFVAKVADIQQNPQNINKHLSDQRIMTLVTSLIVPQDNADGHEPTKEEPKREEPKAEKKESKSETKPQPVSITWCRDLLTA